MKVDTFNLLYVNLITEMKPLILSTGHKMSLNACLLLCYGYYSTCMRDMSHMFHAVIFTMHSKGHINYYIHIIFQ